MKFGSKIVFFAVLTGSAFVSTNAFSYVDCKSIKDEVTVERPESCGSNILIQKINSGENSESFYKIFGKNEAAMVFDESRGPKGIILSKDIIFYPSEKTSAVFNNICMAMLGENYRYANISSYAVMDFVSESNKIYKRYFWNDYKAGSLSSEQKTSNVQNKILKSIHCRLATDQELEIESKILPVSTEKSKGIVTTPKESKLNKVAPTPKQSNLFVVDISPSVIEDGFFSKPKCNKSLSNDCFYYILNSIKEILSAMTLNQTVNVIFFDGLGYLQLFDTPLDLDSSSKSIVFSYVDQFQKIKNITSDTKKKLRGILEGFENKCEVMHSSLRDYENSHNLTKEEKYKLYKPYVYCLSKLDDLEMSAIKKMPYSGQLVTEAYAADSRYETFKKSEDISQLLESADLNVYDKTYIFSDFMYFNSKYGTNMNFINRTTELISGHNVAIRFFNHGQVNIGYNTFVMQNIFPAGNFSIDLLQN